VKERRIESFVAITNLLGDKNQKGKKGRTRIFIKKYLNNSNDLCYWFPENLLPKNISKIVSWPKSNGWWRKLTQSSEAYSKYLLLSRLLPSEGTRDLKLEGENTGKLYIMV
jgi:hypothetical protein